MMLKKYQSIAEHIERAASLIDEFDWTRFNLWRKGSESVEKPWDADRFCVVGALLATADDFVDHLGVSESTNIAERALAIHLGQRTSYWTSYWNDSIAKDKEDVIVHMLDCAKALREGRVKL